MPTNVKKIDSNVAGVSIALEESVGVLPTTPIWQAFEPNGLGDTGGRSTLTQREPINDSRQKGKGVIVDQQSPFSFPTDLTQTNFQGLAEGFFYADFRKKAETLDVPSVTVQAGDDTYELPATAGYYVGSLVRGTDFTNTVNNGVKRVTAVTLDTSVAVAETLVAEATPPVDSKLTVVGFQFSAGDLDVDNTGSLPAITSTTKDLTELGLSVGEPVFIGGDTAIMDFVNAANNGWKFVHSIAANRIEFHKTSSAMVTETGTGKTIQLWLGRHIRNEKGTGIKRRTYQAEIKLGVPDTNQPAQEQSRYIHGCNPGQIVFNIPTAEKATVNMSFLGTFTESRTGAQGLKSGTRKIVTDSSAFNTSSHFKRIKMGLVSNTNPAVTPLFNFVTDMSLTVSNNLVENKAVGVVGAFDITAGFFDVSSSVTAFFTDVGALTAVENNSDVTLDAVLVKENSGIVLDVPLVALANDNLNIQINQPVTLPLSINASSAADFNVNMDYTFSMTFFDYLPTKAHSVA